MLTLRRAQLEAFSKAAVKNFERRTVDRLKLSFPRQCQILGDENLRRRIQDAFTRCRPYDFVSQNGIRMFVELTFLLGNGFDNDPQLPWAAKTLQDLTTDEASRVHLLHFLASDYLEEVGGAAFESALSAFQKESADWITRSSNDLRTDLLAAFPRIYPEKHRRVGVEALRTLADVGIAACRDFGIQREHSATPVLLMFLLGRGFDNDLQYPFALKILTDSDLSNSDRGPRMNAAALEYIRQWHPGA